MQDSICNDTQFYCLEILLNRYPVCSFFMREIKSIKSKENNPLTACNV